MKNDFKSVNFAESEEKMAIGLSASKRSSVPPHLRGRGVENKPNGGPREDHQAIFAAQEEDPAKTAESTAHVSSESLQKTTGVQPTQPSTDSVAEALKSAGSIDAVGKAILLHLQAIEATGYLSADALDLLHKVGDDITARAAAMGSADSPTFPTKPQQNFTQPVRTPLNIPDSGIETDTPSQTKPVARKRAPAEVCGSSRTIPESPIPTPSSPAQPKKASASTAVSSIENEVTNPGAPDFTALMAEAAALTGRVSSLTNKPLAISKPAMKAPATDTQNIPSKPANDTNTPAITPSKADEGDREHKVYFDTWGTQQKRDAPGKHQPVYHHVYPC